MEFWKKIKQDLEDGYKIIFMYVLNSEGSSPGRQGFKMFVSESQLLFGSIGGGFMEHKLVELCKKDLLSKEFKPFFKRQIHQTNIAKDKSGMICSGEQTIAFYQLDNSNISMVSDLLKSISNSKYGVLIANDKGVSFDYGESLQKKFESDIFSSQKWLVKEDMGYFPELHIVGGGHVGLALSKFAYELGFVVTIYDCRAGLNTIKRNKYSQCILLSDFKYTNDYLTSGENKYVVLLSFSYRTDKTILQNLLNLEFKYLGMMGSKEKIKKLFKELLAEGATKAQLNKVYSPIGIQVSSKTPEEIAISILAQIIQVKNNS